jgi:hypothetical protein
MLPMELALEALLAITLVLVLAELVRISGGAYTLSGYGTGTTLYGFHGFTPATIPELVGIAKTSNQTDHPPFVEVQGKLLRKTSFTQTFAHPPETSYLFVLVDANFIAVVRVDPELHTKHFIGDELIARGISACKGATPATLSWLSIAARSTHLRSTYRRSSHCHRFRRVQIVRPWSALDNRRPLATSWLATICRR